MLVLIRKNSCCALLLISFIVLAGDSNAYGQFHEDDILISYQAGQIAFANGGQSFLDANYYFTGEFINLPGNILDRFTEDPGFESWPDFLGANDQLTMTLSPSRFGTYLTVWDAATNAILNSHPYEVALDLPDSLPFDVTDTLGGYGILGSATSSGYFHHHAKFYLSEDAPFGAYGMIMTLSTDAAGIADSDPFWLILNFGMNQADFDHAVGVMIGIPEPSGVLIGSGLLMLMILRRQRTN